MNVGSLRPRFSAENLNNSKNNASKNEIRGIWKYVSQLKITFTDCPVPASRNYTPQDFPPAYTAPTGNYYAAPPPAYTPNPNGYMGWVPPTNVFPDQPPGKQTSHSATFI